MLKIQSRKRVGFWTIANPYRFLEKGEKGSLTAALIGTAFGAAFSVYASARSVPHLLLIGCLLFLASSLLVFSAVRQAQSNITRYNLDPKGSLVDRDLVGTSYDQDEE